jgi:hypothetical protein
MPLEAEAVSQFGDGAASHAEAVGQLAGMDFAQVKQLP